MGAMISGPLDIPKNALAELCRRWKIRELAVFGSVLRDDFGPDSDVDVLLTFEDGVHLGIDEYIGLRGDLVRMFGREVDIVNKRTLRNPYLRHRVLTTRRVLHAA
jgi:predicted nucleotidyltransferase